MRAAAKRLGEWGPAEGSMSLGEEVDTDAGRVAVAGPRKFPGEIRQLTPGCGFRFATGCQRLGHGQTI